MTSVLHAPPQIGDNGPPADPPDNRPFFGKRPCPECLAEFVARERRAIFCCPAHKAAWNNRQTVRGRQLVPFDMVARLTRNGTRGTPAQRATGKRAARDHHKLTQRFRDQDREADRMDMVDYQRLRYQLGYEPE